MMGDRGTPPADCVDTTGKALLRMKGKFSPSAEQLAIGYFPFGNDVAVVLRPDGNTGYLYSILRTLPNKQIEIVIYDRSEIP
jgi:hypothetical protein